MASKAQKAALARAIERSGALRAQFEHEQTRGQRGHVAVLRKAFESMGGQIPSWAARVRSARG